VSSFWPRTLFGRTAATLAAATVLFLLLTLAFLAYFILVPVAQRSADDLAALMVLSAKTWAELPPATREDFERELARQHGLRLAQAAEPLLETATSRIPYTRFLASDLTHRSGQEVAVHATSEADGETWYWADIPAGGGLIRIGFARSRIGASPPLAALGVLAAAALVILLTALVLVRRLNRPLVRLAAAAREVGSGAWPAPLPEEGPIEISALARTFNRMAQDVRELLANRTTLLAGISHDLRTPLARLRLAVEMLPGDADPALVAGLQRDLEIMDALLGQYLELARGMVDEAVETLDLRELVDAVVLDVRRAGAEIRWTPGPAPVPCAVRARALERILANLLDNARRYAAGSEADVECVREGNDVVIRVLDRGPGIPAAGREAVFRPFHRLEPARSAAGGGSGLGLAIARQLADANQWEIALDARAGGGTVARVRLPCATPR
jgi:two-component system osmolarity sensor histidine kinase EnvZ